MDKLYEYLQKKPICYVAKEVYHIDGLDFSRDGVYAITNDSPDARALKTKYDGAITLIANDEPLDTYDLLSHKESQTILKDKAVLVFKNTPRIERFCAEQNIELLNPGAELAKTVEEKVSQVTWLKRDANLLPPHTIQKMRDVLWNNKPFVLQFNAGHTGEGTLYIESEDALTPLKHRFPERDVRVTDFIDGDVYTANPLVFGKDIIPGNISLQITGIAPFTDLRFASVGNDWHYAAKNLSDSDKKAFNAIVQKVGKRLQKEKWRGLFSIDIIRERSTGNWYLIEVNARQGASASFESILQKTDTVLEGHLAALLSLPVHTPKVLTHGAHIFSRVTKENASMYPNNPHNTAIGHITRTDYIMDDPKTVRADLYTKVAIDELPKAARDVAHAFMNFSFGSTCVPIPYLNNRRAGLRGGLNAHIGKGTPDDIQTEVALIARKMNLDTHALTKEDLTHLLVDNNLGIDCSGLVFHILNTLSLQTTGKPLKKHLTFPYITNWITRFRARFAPERHTNVRTLAHNDNSHTVTLEDIAPGDLITMTSPERVNDHVLLCYSVEHNDSGDPYTITYVHSVPWQKDGKYGHGVRTGTITITDTHSSLSGAVWEEKGFSGADNETLGRTFKSTTEIRRLNFLA